MVKIFLEMRLSEIIFILDQKVFENILKEKRITSCFVVFAQIPLEKYAVVTSSVI